MTTLVEIEQAAERLPAAEKRLLVQFLTAQLREADAPAKPARQGHSVMDIPMISLGECLKPLTSDDDLLGEMLEGRT